MFREVRIFFTAVMFFTRLPCPAWVNHDASYLNRSSRYFSLVGLLVGGFGALVYVAASLAFPHALALILSMLSTLLFTGAFHEDGLADVCDGFGGGWTKEDILRIMKDSRLGTFGTLGILFAMGLKFMALFYMDAAVIPLALVAGHGISRFVASTLLYTHPYAREDTHNPKPSAGKMNFPSLAISALFGIAPLMCFRDIYVFGVLIPLFAMRWYLGRYYMKWIGGYTGDCGGATQQICELVFYLSLLILWKFS